MAEIEIVRIPVSAENREALANPEALALFSGRRELQA